MEKNGSWEFVSVWTKRESSVEAHLPVRGIPVDFSLKMPSWWERSRSIWGLYLTLPPTLPH